MSINHTPGPWTVIRGTVYADAGRAKLPMNHADAALIAAAPDLLAALRELVRQIDDFDDTLRRAGSKHDAMLAEACTAIARAEGRS